jgi:hypothetical protein
LELNGDHAEQFTLAVRNLACRFNFSRIQNPSAPTLKFTTPEGWIEEKPSSNMRVGQFKLPKDGRRHRGRFTCRLLFGQGQGG